MRRNNRSLVFGLLFPNGQLSRADLGRQTGLSRVAISGVANSMLDEGLICESGFDVNASGKGKRGTLLSIDTSRLHIISVDLSQEHLVQGAVTDLLGTPQQRMEMALGPDNDINADMIVQLVDQLHDHVRVDVVIRSERHFHALLWRAQQVGHGSLHQMLLGQVDADDVQTRRVDAQQRAALALAGGVDVETALADQPFVEHAVGDSRYRHARESGLPPEVGAG